MPFVTSQRTFTELCVSAHSVKAAVALRWNPKQPYRGHKLFSAWSVCGTLYLGQIWPRSDPSTASTVGVSQPPIACSAVHVHLNPVWNQTVHQLITWFGAEQTNYRCKRQFLWFWSALYFLCANLLDPVNSCTAKCGKGECADKEAQPGFTWNVRVNSFHTDSVGHASRSVPAAQGDKQHAGNKSLLIVH